MNSTSLGKQIERVAIEYNQMQHLVKRGKHLPFMTENEWVTFIHCMGYKAYIHQGPIAHHTYQGYITEQAFKDIGDSFTTVTGWPTE